MEKLVLKARGKQLTLDRWEMNNDELITSDRVPIRKKERKWKKRGT